MFFPNSLVESEIIYIISRRDHKMIQWNLVCNSIKGISLQHSYIKHSNYRIPSSLCVSRDHLKTPPLSLQLSFVEEVCVGCCEFAFHLGRAGHVPSKATFWGSTSQLYIERNVGDFCCRNPLAGFYRNAAISSSVSLSADFVSKICLV